MSVNLIDLIKGQLGPATISQAASQFGESESSISTAVSGLIPAVVGAMAHNADNSSVIDAVMAAPKQGFLGNLLGNASTPVLGGIISTLFGGKMNDLVSSVSSFAGVKNDTVNSLLGAVTGATFGTLGKYAADNNMDRNQVSGILRDQRGIISSILPAGLSLAGLGLGNVFGNQTTTTQTTNTMNNNQDTRKDEQVNVNRTGHTHVDQGKKPNNIWKWLLPLLALGILAWWLLNKNKTKDVVTNSDTVTTVQKDGDTTKAQTTVTQTTATIDKSKTTEVDVNGKKIKGYEGGFESKLVSFLSSKGYDNAADDNALKSTWYDFDNVNFEMGKTDKLLPGSETQLQNLAEILKAYPNTKIRIGGYTDNVGDKDANKKISQGRADFIKAELIKLGVPAAQINGAEGYGSEFAKVPATASDAERASDRKMAIRLAK